MAFNLAALLQAVSPAADGQGTMVSDAPVEDIIVPGVRPRPYQASADFRMPKAPPAPVLSNGPTPPDLGNRAYVEGAQAANANNRNHKGMFGLHGTLRNVLGALGDAFLVQAGKNPVYQPQRMRERAEDALTGFTDNPVAAIERLSQVDPDAAVQLFNQVQNQSINQMRYQSMAQNAADKKYQQYAELFSQYMGSATPETYDRIKPLLKTLVQRGGLGDEFQIPDQFDPELAKSYQYGGMKTTQQVMSDQRASHNAATERAADINARAHMINATRPRPTRSEPLPTAASIAAPLLKKIERGEKLTPGQEEVLRRTGYYPNRGESKKQFSLPPLPPGFKLK